MGIEGIFKGHLEIICSHAWYYEGLDDCLSVEMMARCCRVHY